LKIRFQNNFALMVVKSEKIEQAFPIYMVFLYNSFFSSFILLFVFLIVQSILKIQMAPLNKYVLRTHLFFKWIKVVSEEREQPYT
jgi:hypothetical protein